MKYIYHLIFLIGCFNLLSAQSDRWQQEVNYKMKIDFDVDNHTYKGEQKLRYKNNSPDTLNKVFYHLYFNAFQPGSMMDERSRTIMDPDRRVGDRISKLLDDEMGYIKVSSLKQDGKDLQFEVVGTILEVTLNKAITPGKSANLEMNYEAQVPIQIRRSGRNSSEGIDYSMAQWYPKLCEYDYQGWHANPYVGREFYGIWGDFEVEIKIDDSYTLGATGILQNAKKIGRGYSDESAKVKGKKICWKFKAENVHDFVWAADRDYVVEAKMTDSGVKIYYVYQPGERTTENWQNLHKPMNEALKFMNKNFGEYPYPVYSFIQGGDGGMEYPMATLITGERSFGSLVGVSVHEWMHSWYQMLLGTNEALYPWMDEGFTTYGSSKVMNHLREKELIPGSTAAIHPNEGNIKGYVNFAKTGLEEPISTHSDHYITNSAYGRGSYTKGAVFLKQLEYVIGENAVKTGLIKYYNEWKYKHPNVNDFIRVMEKVSGIELDWYKEYFVNTVHTIDYGIDSVLIDNDKATKIVLYKNGVMPMPVDVNIKLINGTSQNYNIPLRMMRGNKEDDGLHVFSVAEDWPWTHRFYELIVPFDLSEIEAIEIDKSFRMADADRSNNVWVKTE